MPAVIPCYDMAGNAVRNPRAIASGVDAIVARLRTRWWTIRGEWPEDVSFGLPWEEWGHGPQTSPRPRSPQRSGGRPSRSQASSKCCP